MVPKVTDARVGRKLHCKLQRAARMEKSFQQVAVSESGVSSGMSTVSVPSWVSAGSSPYQLSGNIP